MPIALTIGKYGIIVINDVGELLWEWVYPNMTMYGLDVDPDTGNFYVATYGKILEVTRMGHIVWSFSSHETQGLHSLQVTPEGNILVSCAPYDRVLEINKKDGVVWRWDTADHYDPPPGHEERITRNPLDIHGIQWTHLNHAWRLPNGDTLIGLYYNPDPNKKLPNEYSPEDQPDGMIIRVNREGKILWEWGKGITKHQHYCLPYDEDFIVCDSHNERVLIFSPTCTGTHEISLTERVLGLDIKPNGNILVTCPNSLTLHEIDLTERKSIWQYQVPEKLRHEGSKLFTPKYLPEWSVDYTPEEQEKIEERLRRLGYIG